MVVGAHYDSAPGSPGANDNGSGVAALLALARRCTTRPARTLRLIWFANEEPPHFQEPTMGSLHAAYRSSQRNDDIVAMLSLETIGYFSDAADSQRYPTLVAPFYPSTGNFIAFVGNPDRAHWCTAVVGAFRRHARFPSEGAALPASIPGVGWSDQWSYWQQGYPALMVTDTAPFRYPYYHSRRDTADRIDYERMARVTSGLRDAITSCCGLRHCSRRAFEGRRYFRATACWRRESHVSSHRPSGSEISCAACTRPTLAKTATSSMSRS